MKRSKCKCFLHKCITAYISAAIYTLLSFMFIPLLDSWYYPSKHSNSFYCDIFHPFLPDFIRVLFSSFRSFFFFFPICVFCSCPRLFFLPNSHSCLFQLQNLLYMKRPLCTKFLIFKLFSSILLHEKTYGAVLVGWPPPPPPTSTAPNLLLCQIKPPFFEHLYCD